MTNLTTPDAPADLLDYGRRSKSRRRFVAVFTDAFDKPTVLGRSDNFDTIALRVKDFNLARSGAAHRGAPHSRTDAFIIDRNDA
jgi:hypothetical protein